MIQMAKVLTNATHSFQNEGKLCSPADCEGQKPQQVTKVLGLVLFPKDMQNTDRSVLSKRDIAYGVSLHIVSDMVHILLF